MKAGHCRALRELQFILLAEKRLKFYFQKPKVIFWKEEFLKKCWQKGLQGKGQKFW